MPIKQVLLVISVLAASASVAHAHNTRYSWTTRTAEVMLPGAARIELPQDLKGSLKSELDGLIAEFRLLELTAQQDPDDWLLAGTYGNYVTRFSDARERVVNGLSIDKASCVGTGKALGRKRYKHFRCAATSYVLEVPSVELGPRVDGALPEVTEGPMRRMGPFDAVFAVHVIGKTDLVQRRLS
jgi:hypothetical protein